MNRRVLVRDALAHGSRGDELYRSARLSASAQAFRRASQLAGGVGQDAEDLEDRSRFWLGASLHATGRLREALVAWAPVLNRLGSRAMNRDRYLTLTRYLLVAVDLPLPLAQIEAVVGEVESRVRASPGGDAGMRSRVLLARARLALNRGDVPAGLQLAQEATARGTRESEGYSASSYYRTLLRACLDAGDLRLARVYLRDWEGAHDIHAETKALLLAAGHASYQLRLGDARGALDAIEHLEGAVRGCEDVFFRTEAGCALVRAFLAAGLPERARTVLARLAGARHCAIGELRFQTRLLMADWWAAAVGGGSDEGAAAKAARALDAAGREAERLDALLECGRHGGAVGGRGSLSCGEPAGRGEDD